MGTEKVQLSPPGEETSRRPGRLPIVRTALGGALMGLANLVPGVSGGTMILVTGLYDTFITSVADVTRLRFTRRNVAFLAIIGGAASVVIAVLAGTLSRAVTLHPAAMFSLFIGLTLGGVPLLSRMLARVSASSATGIVLGFASMTVLAITTEEPPDREAIRDSVAAGEFVIRPSYPRDVAAGAMGMSAMVLPGVSGAYMLLVLDRYETILASIAAAKDYAASWDREGAPPVFLHVLIPTAFGALVSLVFLSNLLKWTLRRHEKPTLGALLGILLGSVVGIWPFDATSQAGDYVLGVLLAIAGFLFTTLLSRISA